MTIFFLELFKSIKKRSQSKILVDGLYGTIHTPYAVFSDDMYDGITELKTGERYYDDLKFYCIW